MVDVEGDDASSPAAPSDRPSSEDARTPLLAGIGVPATYLPRSALPDFGRLIAQRDEAARVMSSIYANTGALHALRNLRVLEGVRVPMMELGESVSRLVLGPSMLSANFAALTADLRLSSLFHDLDVSTFARANAAVLAQIDSIRRVAGLLDDRSALLAGIGAQAEVARPVDLATRAWDDIVRVSSRHVSDSLLDRIEIAGKGTGWAVQAGVLLAGPDEDDVEEIDAEAVAVFGPAVASAEVRARLAALHPSLCERLDGAWERILGGGPDAASQGANSLMETIDWCLRMIAPDADVLAWHASQGRPETELYEGKPTRPLRLRYAMRSSPEKNSGLDLYLRALGELVRAVQAPKHALELHVARSLVPIAMSVEGLLHLLLVD